ncbi:cytochrome P450 [Nocardiopsis sp. CC223A]|uniref:cytochrome P450 n=1 Tax=Nocardiopsis sp. CC223A TaxID=3044051 RepID=UPI00278BAF33|nr:cytochrome P450 [Nocardiopsis sp. CC223A]
MTTRSSDGEAACGRPADLPRLYGPTPDTGRDSLWDELRERHGPVAAVELEPGVRAWLLLGYRENLTVLQSPHLFSRDTRRWREVIEGRVDLSAARPTLSWRPNVLYADDAEHTRLRTPIVSALSRVDMAAAARDVRRIADGLIDAFIADGEADLIGGFADPLPVLVLNRLYGLPDGYGHMLGDLTGVVFGDDARRAEDAVVRIQQYFAGLVARKRSAPGHDLASWMLEHANGLTDHEVAHQAALMNSAGHLPTTHLIGNTMHTLLTDERIRAAHADARLSVRELLDHVMWTDTPFQVLPARFALQDVRIGAAEVRAGDALLIGFDPAHRDPAVRRGREETGVVSGARAHLMFGAGPHACPARELARLIAATGVSALHERLAGLRPAVDPVLLRRVPSPFVRGLAVLPVEFTPGEPGPRPAADPEPAPGPDAEEAPREESDDLLGRLFAWWWSLRR